MVQFGISNSYDPIHRLIVRKPDIYFAVSDPGLWHYQSTPDRRMAEQEHQSFTETLIKNGIEVNYHQEILPGKADSIFVFDPVLMTPRGAVQLRMGKKLRRGEEIALALFLKDLGIPILSSLEDPAFAEGGDLLWLDSETLAVGLGFRTNLEAVKQLSRILADQEVRLIPVELPYFQGPQACLHLLSLISVLDKNLAVAYLPLLPVTFVHRMRESGFDFVEVPEEEFSTMAANILAIGPRQCLMLEGNPITQRRLEAAGCRVSTYRGNEISLKAEGGPTCLTLPLLRCKNSPKI